MATQTNFYNVHVPTSLKFMNLCVSVDSKKILEDVSGEVKPGEILAIMGPSGAGKTTLLNFLSGREGNVTLDSGQILINGQTATDELRRRTGYIMQSDIFFSHLTVDQTLQFVGEVRLSDKLSKSEKRKIVDDVIDSVGLSNCVDTVMGGDFFNPGCSGGEKKRTSVACELISNPSLLIMDEPTTGLDSTSARKIIEQVQKLACDTNRSIITTIHQPSSQVFHMFDKLLLICNGKMAYYGKTSGLVNFLDYIGMPCYPNWNLADYIMEILVAGEEIENRVVEGYKDFIRSPGNRKLCLDDEQKRTTTSDEAPVDEWFFSEPSTGDTFDGKSFKTNLKESLIPKTKSTEFSSEKLPEYPTGFLTQMIALAKRSFVQSRREIWDKHTFFQFTFVPIMIGLLWLNTPYTEVTVSSRTGAIFYMLIYLVMIPMFNALMTFPVEKGTIAKERADGMYRLSAYYIAKCMSELPVMLLQPAIFYTIAYWMVGLNRSVWFLVGVLTTITFSIMGQTIGLLLGASIPNFKNALTFSLILSQACVLVSGYFAKRLPFWLTWAKYLSHLTYAYNIFLRIEFDHAVREFKCAAESTYSSCLISNTTRYITGPEITDRVSPIHLGIGESFAILWGVIILLRFILYFILKYL